MREVFSHSGDAGDLIAALPGIAKRGGGKLILYPASCTGNRMMPARAESLKPLLEEQEYIEWAEWAAAPEGIIVDHWRNHYRNDLNLADMQSEFLGVAHWDRNQPWLKCSAKKEAKVVMHRSERYRNWNFPWREVWKKYHKEAIFVGHPDEHSDFCFNCGPIAYYETKNYLELAQIINGCDLYIGNQSSPFWVAAGLCKRLILEVCLRNQNCHFSRANFYYGTNEHVQLPDL